MHYELLLMWPRHDSRATTTAVVRSQQGLLQAICICVVYKLFSTHSLSCTAVAEAAPAVAVYLGPLCVASAHYSLLTEW